MPGIFADRLLTSEQPTQENIWLTTVQSLFFILVGLFGTENLAFFNSFDPSNVNCFLTIFNQFLMGTIVLFKRILPILIVNYATIYVIKNVDLICSLRCFRSGILFLPFEPKRIGY